MGATENGNWSGDASKEEQAQLKDESQIKSVMSNRKIYVNLILVAIAFLLNMGSYMTMEGLQSSLNSDVGTQSVSAVYCSFVLTSFFLPTLAMEFLKSRKAMVIGTIPYALYSLANCYPRPYTLIPIAILLGAGASVIWSANRVYVSDLAAAYARQNRGDEGKTTSHFYGIFWAIFSLSLIIGNIVSSAVIQNFGFVEESGTAISNSSVEITEAPFESPLSTTTPESELVVLTCALHNCDPLPENYSKIVDEGDKANLNPAVLYALFGTFAAIQFGSALLLLFVSDDAPPRESISAKDTALAWKSSDGEKVTESPQYSSDDEGDSSTVTQRVKKQVLATAKFLAFNHDAKALILITVHIGILQGYAFGQFTKYWVTCVHGLEYIGYVSAMFGAGSTAGGYGAGYLAQHTGRSVIMGITWLVEMAVMVFLLIWEPEIISDKWLFFATFTAFGIVHATYKTIITTATTLFFTSDKEAASASLSIWDPLGAAIAYAITTTICNRVYTILMMVIVTIGTILYLFVERNFKKSSRETAVET